MVRNLLEDRAELFASQNGIEVYRVPMEKFKTNTINIFFLDNLSRENAAKNALLPAVLRRGTEKFPTFQEIALYLEELYGAAFDCGVSKKGELQVIQFYVEYVSDRYTLEKSNLFEKTFDLLLDIITKPVLTNGLFKNEYIDQERENLKKLIESRVNDKVQYAVEKCFEEMCSDEPFGIHEYGSIKDLEGIDAKSLFEHYRSFLENLPVKVYITGDVEEGRISEVIKKLLQMKRGKIKDVRFNHKNKEIKDVNQVVEKMNINQGKLCLGFRTGTMPQDNDYYHLLVYNTILGGGMHSKLFQNVREKASLAYYAFARLEKFKGLLVMSSGIETQNKEKAMNIMLEQMEEIKKGNISDSEFDSSVKVIETGIKSLKDSQLQVVDFNLSQSITDTNDNFDSIIEKVKKVSKQDVVNVSKKIVLDTVYFLTSKDA
ncbi:MAG: insulinase family protein [Clostridia bacterium]|nr:insulinase family protein [Clostridia bacterium]